MEDLDLSKYLFLDEQRSENEPLFGQEPPGAPTSAANPVELVPMHGCIDDLSIPPGKPDMDALSSTEVPQTVDPTQLMILPSINDPNVPGFPINEATRTIGEPSPTDNLAQSWALSPSPILSTSLPQLQCTTDWMDMNVDPPGPSRCTDWLNDNVLEHTGELDGKRKRTDPLTPVPPTCSAKVSRPLLTWLPPVDPGSNLEPSRPARRPRAAARNCLRCYLKKRPCSGVPLCERCQKDLTTLSLSCAVCDICVTPSLLDKNVFSQLILMTFPDADVKRHSSPKPPGLKVEHHCCTSSCKIYNDEIYQHAIIMSSLCMEYCLQLQPGESLGQDAIDASRTLLGALEDRLRPKSMVKLPLCIIYATYVALGLVLVHTQHLRLMSELNLLLLGSRDRPKLHEIGKALERTILGFGRWIRDHGGEGLPGEGRKLFETEGAFGSTAALVDRMLQDQTAAVKAGSE